MLKSLSKNSLIGGVCLISGSCIGAGMLALPVVTGLAGFYPSLLMFLLAWAFMTTTGFLTLEANLAFEEKETNMLTMASKLLGPLGKAFVTLLFVFLFYCLNIAYVAGLTNLLEQTLKDYLNLLVPIKVLAPLSVFVFGLIVVKGAKSVDATNRLLVVGLIVSYLALVLLGAPYIEAKNLMESDLKYLLMGLPVMIISFGFHNMLPSLREYFENDIPKLKKAVFIGSLIPLVIYLLWQLVVLGLIPTGMRGAYLEVLKNGGSAPELLRETLGTSNCVVWTILFAFFAITTSYLAQSLSLVDFLADGFKVGKHKLINRLGLVALALGPSLIVNFVAEDLFLKALGIAGGYGAVLLFGVIPVLMVKKARKEGLSKPIVPGGKITLGLIILASVGIMLLQMGIGL